VAGVTTELPFLVGGRYQNNYCSGNINGFWLAALGDS